MLPKVFVSEPVHQKGLDLLKDKAELVFAPDTSRETAVRLIRDAHAALLRATTIFDKSVLDAAQKLKIIARTGVGYNNVDIKKAGEKGIYVCITPGTNNETVAEHAIAMIFALAKQIIHLDKSVRNQHWQDRFSTRQQDIKGKIVGLVGLGSIGQQTAKRCLALGMKVMAFDPYFKGDMEGVALASSIDDIFINANFVSVHCPLTPETEGLINKQRLALMKPSAYLINTSRGELVDETDLVEALENQTIAGAALDVFQKEPPAPDAPLLQMPNVILSPHVAGLTVESDERLAMMAARAVLDVLEGKRPNHICNEKYLKKDQ